MERGLRTREGVREGEEAVIEGRRARQGASEGESAMSRKRKGTQETKMEGSKS